MKFSFPADGGTLTYDLPPALAVIGFWVIPSQIPDTPPWEWAITNINAHIFPGLTNGYTDTEDAAKQAVHAALTFWRARSYETVDLPAIDGQSP